MSAAHPNRNPDTPGYPEEAPKPRDGDTPDEKTPHEHQNVPEQKPQPTP